MAHKSLTLSRAALGLFLLAVVFNLAPLSAFSAGRTTLGFWQGTQLPTVQIDSSSVGPNPTNADGIRSMTLFGVNVVKYKAITLNTGSCVSPGVPGMLQAAPEYNIQVPFSFSLLQNAETVICAIGLNNLGRWQSSTSPTSYSLIVENTPPYFVAGFMEINGGQASTNNNYLAVRVRARDDWTGVARVCFKYGTTAQPDTTDSCWTPVGSIGYSPGPDLTIENAPARLALAPGLYSLYVWAQDMAGNISSLTNSGAGTWAQDLETIEYYPPVPPVLLNVVGANTDSVSSAPNSSQINFSVGQPVVIKWKASAANGFGAGPITLSYSTDGIVYTEFDTGISNSARAGCTVDGVEFTGCYVWNSPGAPSAYFQIQVSVMDTKGMVAKSTTTALNTGSFQIIAGNTSLGLGGSAAAAMFMTAPKTGTSNVEVGQTQAFVFTPAGILYFNDTSRGILRVDPANGLQTIFIPKTGSYSGEGGAATSATLVNPTKIALDFSGNLLIYDADRILIVNSKTGLIRTLIGGGSSTASGTIAANFRVSNSWGDGYWWMGRTFVPAPNGDLYFNIGNPFIRTIDGATLYRYSAADGRVYSLQFTGTGALSINGVNGPGVDVTRYWQGNIGIRFDMITRSPLFMVTRLDRAEWDWSGWTQGTFNPTTGLPLSQTAQVPMAVNTPWCNLAYFTSFVGDFYSFMPCANAAYKYNPATNSWVLILGGSGEGQSPDGSAAIGAFIKLEDFFVDATNTIYFLDGGSIRTIVNGNIQTVFGQRLSSGEGSSPINARFPKISHIAMSQGNKIVIVDHMGGYLWEFGRSGSLNRIAGNGTIGSWPVVGSSADQTPFVSRQWDWTPGIIIDTSTNFLYTSGQSSGWQIVRLNRATGKWEAVNNPGAPYWLSDGLNSSSFTYLAWGMIGFDGVNLLTTLVNWNYENQYREHNYMKTYDVTTGVQAAFAGVPSTTSSPWGFDPDGTLMASSFNFPDSGNAVRGTWDGPRQRWLLGNHCSTRVVTVPYSSGIAGSIGTLTMTQNGYSSFAFRVEGSSQILYYCGCNGRLYRRQIAAALETELSLGSSTVSCYGRTLNVNESLKVLEFPIVQNSLYGVGQYAIDP